MTNEGWEYNTAAAARFAFDLDAADFGARFAARYPNMTPAQFKRVMTIVEDESQRQLAQYQAQAERSKADMALFEGLPEGLTFGEAVEIKAAQGDPHALEWKQRFESYENRLAIALIRAAAAAHPAWIVNGDGSYRTTDPSDPTCKDNSGGALIDWFQMNYPREAKAIEASVSTDAP